MRRFAAIVVMVWAAGNLAAQTSLEIPPESVVEHPIKILAFSDPVSTSLGKPGTMMFANTLCAEDGSVFLQVADSPEDHNEVVLHSLSGPTQDTRFDTKHIQGYKYVSITMYFVNDNRVVALADAQLADNPLVKPAHSDEIIQIILLFDRKGNIQDVIRVPGDISAKAVGIYGSGDLLVIAMEKEKKNARFLVMNNKGDIRNEFILFDADYNTGQGTKRKQPLASVFPDGGPDFLQLIPHGDNLLLLASDTTEAVLEVNEGGVVRSVQLQLPPKATLTAFLSQNSTTWNVLSSKSTELRTDAQSGKQSGISSFGPLFQFNAADGSIVQEVALTSRPDSVLVCEHNEAYIAFTHDRRTGLLAWIIGHAE